MSEGKAISPRLFAEYLDSLIEGASQEEAAARLPESLLTSILSVLEYLHEDLHAIPPPLDISVVRLAHAIAIQGES